MYVLAVNCTDPPERHQAGTWEWNGEYSYSTQIEYTCGPYGKFIDTGGNRYETFVSTCEWNKTWTPSFLDSCVAASCPVVPFPPTETGMILFEDPNNVITLESDSSKYSPRLPVSLKMPQDNLCSSGGKVLKIVGIIPTKARKAFHIIFEVDGLDEAFHVVVDKADNFLERWGIKDNITVERQGEPGDGTSIDYDEPFVMTFECDEDGWTFQVNKEVSYLTFYHLFPPTEITEVKLTGTAEITYVGFMPKGKLNLLVFFKKL